VGLTERFQHALPRCETSIGGTVNAINKINRIIEADGTGKITVVVGPLGTPQAK
jgi:hypothetical protein